jgi:transcriptional regulator of acetoin/glycerol metabolism
MQAMNQRVGELQALNELGQAMNSGLGLDESLELIATLAAEAQRQLYLEALRAERGDILRAAQLLGMSRATLYRRLKQDGLNRRVDIARSTT